MLAEGAILRSATLAAFFIDGLLDLLGQTRLRAREHLHYGRLRLRQRQQQLVRVLGQHCLQFNQGFGVVCPTNHGPDPLGHVRLLRTVRLHSWRPV